MKKVLQFLKEHLFTIIIYIILFTLLACEFIELDYSVYSPGGLVNITERIENSEYESKGSFNMTYVTYRKGTIFNLMIAKILPSQDIVKNDDITISSNEDIEDSLNRSEISMKEAIANATYIAYNKADKELTPIATHFYTYYIYEDATTNLKIGDEVIKCDDKEIKGDNDLLECVSSHDINEDIELVVLRKNKEVKTISRLREEDKKIGVIFNIIHDYEKNPNITYKGEKNELGSSCGLMLTLSFYNALVEEDITKGKLIAGTGTMEADGTVGEIAGIKYKIKGAARNKVDLFIVPEANYEEAKQVIEENHYDLKLLKAKTFDQVLEDLKNYN